MIYGLEFLDLSYLIKEFHLNVQDVLEDYYECMKTVDEDIAEIKAELLVVSENFTKIDVKMDDMDVEIMTNKMNSEEADQCLREELENDKAQTDKVIIQKFHK